MSDSGAVLKMQHPVAKDHWRDKVNPLFVGAIQFVRFISRLVSNLQMGEDLEDQSAKFFVELCHQTLQFLPAKEENPQDEKEIGDLSALFDEDEGGIFTRPEVRSAFAQLAVRFASSPRDLLGKGFAAPHWWMRYPRWLDFLKTDRIAHSFLNLLSVLHYQISLSELTQRITQGDPKLYKKLFCFDRSALMESGETADNI